MVKEKLQNFNNPLELTIFLHNQIQTVKDQIGLFVEKQLKM